MMKFASICVGIILFTAPVFAEQKTEITCVLNSAAKLPTIPGLIAEKPILTATDTRAAASLAIKSFGSNFAAFKALENQGYMSEAESLNLKRLLAKNDEELLQSSLTNILSNYTKTAFSVKIPVLVVGYKIDYRFICLGNDTTVFLTNLIDIVER